MKAKIRMATMLALGTLLTAAFAQGPQQGGPMPQSQSQRNGSGQGQTNQQSSSTETTATIQLLGSQQVEKDLGITSDQYSQLSQIASGFANQQVTENTALTSVSSVLTEAQTTKLTGMLVQYLGYRSLQLTTVQSKLNLTSDQQTRVADILSLYTVAKKTAQSSRNGLQNLGTLNSLTDSILAKVLTTDQDKVLRAMATAS